jgi:hypothetical protein
MSDIAQGYFNLMTKILQHFAGDAFKDEIRLAKAQFFDNAGILDEKSPQYELRMNQFFDWYLFTRDLAGHGLTPLQAVNSARELRFGEDELLKIEQLKNHRHSLFEFLKIKDQDIYLKDLIRNEKITVKKSPWVYGFESDELFEARLIPSGENWIFTKGLCFHPSEARSYILSEIKRHRKDPDLNPEVMMLKLVRMRYQFERYRHVKVNLIYSNSSRLGG